MAARPVIENYCRAAGKLTRGGMGASPGEKWSQGGKLGKAERSPEAPGEVVMVSKPKLEKWKASMGTSQEEWTLMRSWLTVVEDN